ncbi:hypothetical protein EV702DRAFT_1203724 [Suillus placidus]|uniref:Uncharacterized protein n=1 Tax=Suillus placidus TaxID=48579 RepID=A0A9P7CX91_9AGAM|nr:hypothetical protein EV702DRAFT_1203724 [Suillus placidus]
MSSQNGAYDQNLLDEAPATTKAQRQEGYNVDLLDDRPTRSASTQPLKPPQTIPSDTDVESSSLTGEKIVPGAATYASHPTQSFWRTRNGKITIFVIAVVVLGAVVGGAVGGTVGKIGSNNHIPAPQNVTSGSSTASSTSSSSYNGTGVTQITTGRSSTDTNTTPTPSSTAPGLTPTKDAGSDGGVLDFYRL